MATDAYDRGWQSSEVPSTRLITLQISRKARLAGAISIQPFIRAIRN